MCLKCKYSGISVIQHILSYQKTISFTKTIDQWRFIKNQILLAEHNMCIVQNIIKYLIVLYVHTLLLHYSCIILLREQILKHN